MRNFKVLILILSVILLIFMAFKCSDPEKVEKESGTKVDTLKLKELATERFNEQFIIMKNQSGTYALVIEGQKGKMKSPVNLKSRYFLFDYNSNRIIFEDEISNASVNWTNDSLITVSRPLGIVIKESDSKTSSVVYTYNVIKRKKSYK